MSSSLSVQTIDVRERIPDDVIKELTRRIADKFTPKLIILFGSYAYGTPRPESDVDLLIIMDTELKESQQAVQIRQHINPLFGVDILVYTPERLEERLSWGDQFLQEILDRGIVVYESVNKRMG
jgi:uncharacterized protein